MSGRDIFKEAPSTSPSTSGLGTLTNVLSSLLSTWRFAAGWRGTDEYHSFRLWTRSWGWFKYLHLLRSTLFRQWKCVYFSSSCPTSLLPKSAVVNWQVWALLGPVLPHLQRFLVCGMSYMIWLWELRLPTCLYGMLTRLWFVGRYIRHIYSSPSCYVSS